MKYDSVNKFYQRAIWFIHLLYLLIALFVFVKLDLFIIGISFYNRIIYKYLIFLDLSSKNILYNCHIYKISKQTLWNVILLYKYDGQWFVKLLDLCKIFWDNCNFLNSAF